MSQTNPVFQVPVGCQKTLEDGTQFRLIGKQRDKQQSSGTPQTHLDALRGDDSQRSPSGATVFLTVSPRQPDGGQEETRIVEGNPALGALLLKPWKQK